MNRDHVVFLRLLDALPVALVYFDLQGHRVHANRTARDLLRTLPDQRQAARAIGDFAQVCLESRARVTEKSATLEWKTKALAHASMNLVARGSVVPLHLFDTDAFVLVVLTESLTPWSSGDLRAAFRLTRQQARIAIALAAGLSNREIAQRLSISEHTARRHTEQVMLKLNLRSRAQVADLLARATPEQRKALEP